MLKVLMKMLPLSELLLRQLRVGHQDLHLGCPVVAESWVLRATVLFWQRVRPWTSVWVTRTSRQTSISGTVGIFLSEIGGLVLAHLNQCTRRPSEDNA